MSSRWRSIGVAEERVADWDTETVISTRDVLRGHIAAARLSPRSAAGTARWEGRRSRLIDAGIDDGRFASSKGSRKHALSDSCNADDSFEAL